MHHFNEAYPPAETPSTYGKNGSQSSTQNTHRPHDTDLPGPVHGYMEKAISGKVHASEPPENFQEFVEDYREAYGFEFDPEKISPNASLRSLNKLTANSLWGKVWMSRHV